MNLITSRVQEGCVFIGRTALRIDASRHDTVILGLRPEHLRFGDVGMPGRVTLAEPMGREVLYEVETGLGRLRILDPVHETRHREGANVMLSIAAEDILAFDPQSGEVLMI
jgi:inositol-phosphate transport system ATP-binding protein